MTRIPIGDEGWELCNSGHHADRDLKPAEDYLSALRTLLPWTSDPSIMAVLRGLCYGTGSDLGDTATDREVIELVAQRLQTGVFHICRPAEVDKDAGGAQAQPEPVKKKEDDAALVPKRITKTWVEFVVLDMEGNPAVGQHYLIMLPDGSLHEGKIGKNGNVRFEGIYPENSVFTLPELDQEAWERAG